jgi:hypothetical protein
MNLRGLSGHTRLGFLVMAHDGGPAAAPRRRRLWTWPGIGTGIVLVAFVVAGCSPAASKPASPHPSPSASKSSASTALAKTALGPSACVTAARPTGGSGPWKLVPPPTLCGLPVQTSEQYLQTAQGLASIDKILFSMNNVGPVTSTVTATYQSPPIPNFSRSVAFVGFEGTFHPAAAASVLEGTTYTYTAVPPGPHGGAMGCANEEGTEQCVWATSTTLCEIQILDSTGELTGASLAANAIRIRDALEAPG